MSSCTLLVCVLVSTHAQQPAWLEPVQSGFGHQTAGRWVEAVAAYRAAIAAGLPAQHQLTVASNLGLALQNTGALNEALLIYDKVLRVLPTNADTHHNRGNALYQAARPSPHAAAEPMIIGLVRCRLRLRPRMRSSQAGPDSRPGLHWRRLSPLAAAYLLWQASRHVEAMSAFDAAVLLVPTDGESHFNRGNAADKAGRREEAAAAFGAALALEPSDKAAAFNQANALAALGRNGEAEARAHL